MPQIPTHTTPEATALRVQLIEERTCGLLNTGPQRECADEDQDSAVRAAGVTAYYPTGDEC